jgi:ArsR family metal-binding transcriptional regulator
MLVVKKEVEITLYPHGRVLMHPVSTKEDAHRLASELYSAVEM